MAREREALGHRWGGDRPLEARMDRWERADSGARRITVPGGWVYVASAEAAFVPGRGRYELEVLVDRGRRQEPPLEWVGAGIHPTPHDAFAAACKDPEALSARLTARPERVDGGTLAAPCAPCGGWRYALSGRAQWVPLADQDEQWMTYEG